MLRNVYIRIFPVRLLSTKSGVSPTHKKPAPCNVLNVNELLNIQYNNKTTLLQYLDISMSVLQATKSWAGLGNEANVQLFLVQLL